MTLIETLNQAKHSLFRFEYLQEFAVNSEKELWDIWKTEQRIDDQYMKEWWNYIEEKRRNNITMQRVSLIRFPLTEYKEMELEVFKRTVPYGDDIRIITGDVLEGLDTPRKDFWLIDDAIVVNLNYGSNGEWIGFDTSPDDGKFLKTKQLLLNHSQPLLEFKY